MTNRPVITVLLPWNFERIAKSVQGAAKGNQQIRLNGDRHGMRVTATVQDFLRLGLARESHEISDPLVGRLRTANIPVNASRTVHLPGSVTAVEISTTLDPEPAQKIASMISEQQGSPDITTIYDRFGVGHTASARGSSREAAWYDPRTWGKGQGQAPAQQQAPAQKAPMKLTPEQEAYEEKRRGWDIAKREQRQKERKNWIRPEPMRDIRPLPGRPADESAITQVAENLLKHGRAPGDMSVQEVADAFEALGVSSKDAWDSFDDVTKAMQKSSQSQQPVQQQQTQQQPAQQQQAQGQQGKAWVPTSAQQALYNRVKQQPQQAQAPRGASRRLSAAESNKHNALVTAIRDIWEANGEDVAQLVDWDLSEYEAPEVQDIIRGVLPEYLTDEQLETWNDLEPEEQSKILERAFPRNAIRHTKEILDAHFENQTRGASRGEKPRTLEACVDPLDLGLRDPENLVRVNERGTINNIFS